MRKKISDLEDAVTNGSIVIKRIVDKHCRFCREDVRRRIDEQADRILQALRDFTGSDVK